MNVGVVFMSSDLAASSTQPLKTAFSKEDLVEAGLDVKIENVEEKKKKKDRRNLFRMFPLLDESTSGSSNNSSR